MKGPTESGYRIQGYANAADRAGLHFDIGDITFLHSTLPLVMSITPNTGPAAGGTAVTITGWDLAGSTGVTFAGVAATAFTVTTGITAPGGLSELMTYDSSITCTTPAHATGPVDVIVVNPRGNVTGAGAYTYT